MSMNLHSPAGALDLMRELPVLFQLAEALLPTKFLPKKLETAGQVVAVLLTGRELGLPPMTSLRTINIVDGKIEMSANLQLALANRAGIKHRFLEQSDQRCILELQTPGEDPVSYAYTMEDAKRAELLERGRPKDGGKTTWEKHPKAMLRARCTSNAVDAHCPEVLCGGVYDHDEMAEIVDDTSPVRTIAALPSNANATSTEYVDDETGEVTTHAPARELSAGESRVEVDANDAAQATLQKMAAEKPAKDEPLFAWGDKKGQPVSSGSLDEIENYGLWLNKCINDPAKARYKQKNIETCDAVREIFKRKLAELDKQRPLARTSPDDDMGELPPAWGGPPSEKTGDAAE
jgi:hypothetical protein